MVMAAFSLLGLWPLGIVAIVHASSVTEKWNICDKPGAMKAAGKAKGWAIASWAVAVILLVLIPSIS